MTLTVDEVRNIRFPMARQPNEDGYRASAVDNFIDRLEVSYAQIVDENQRLKASGGGGAADENLRRQLDALAQERDELGRQRADLQGRLADMQNRLAAASQGDPGQQAAMRAHIDELTRSNQDLQARLAAAPQSDPGQAAAMQGRIEELMRANQDLRSQLSAVPTGASEQLSRIGEENASLRSHGAVLESQVRDLQARLAAVPASNVGVIEGDTRRIVVTTSAEASPAVVLLVQQTLQQVQVLMDNAKREIDQHRAEAEIEARRLVETATQQASELSRRAQTDADSLKADATVTADRVIAEARSRASAIDTEAAERRTQIFGQLEHEKDQLSQRIGQLRDFESQYRSSMTGHLQRQLDSLREIEFAPSGRPELMESGRQSFSLGR